MLFGTVAPAQAAGRQIDHRPCVSKREFYGTPRDHYMTRTAIEQRWDVVGLGITATDLYAEEVYVETGLRPLIFVKRYPTCGYSAEEVQTYLGYRRDTHVMIWIMRWNTGHATAHGHVRLIASSG